MKFKTLLLAGLLALIPALAWAGWNVQEHSDPITGKTAMYASLIVAAPGGRAADAGITLKCDDVNNPESFWILVHMNDYLISDGFIKVVTRFDEEPPQESRHFADGRTFYVMGGEEDEFLERIRAANKLAIRAYDYDGDPHTVVFPLAGATGAAAKLPCLQ